MSHPLRTLGTATLAVTLGLGVLAPAASAHDRGGYHHGYRDGGGWDGRRDGHRWHGRDGWRRPHHEKHTWVRAARVLGRQDVRRTPAANPAHHARVERDPAATRFAREQAALVAGLTGLQRWLAGAADRAATSSMDPDAKAAVLATVDQAASRVDALLVQAKGATSTEDLRTVAAVLRDVEPGALFGLACSMRQARAVPSAV